MRALARSRRSGLTSALARRRVRLHVHRPESSPPDEAAEAARRARHAALEEALRSSVQHILRTVNDKREHIPPVVSTGVVSFPFEIALPTDEGGYGDTLKRFVTAVRPPVNVL